MFPDIIYRDTACALDEWLKILKYLNPYYSKGMLFDSVWEVAREYEEMPHFGNICQEIVLKDLKREIRFCRPDWSVVYEINARASFLMVDDQDIVDYGQFLEMLKEDGHAA